jgi:hypothetical protein
LGPAPANTQKRHKLWGPYSQHFIFFVTYAWDQ